MTGVATSNLPTSTTVDDVLGNSGGNTRRIPIDRLVALIAALMGPTYAQRSQLFADLNWPAGAIGYVRADGNTAFNGVYKKSGNSGSGSWSRIGDLPTGALELSLLDDIVVSLNSFGVRAYGTRAEAEANAQALPSGITHVLVREDTALVVRSRTATADDPLYTTAPRWGVVQRQDTGQLRLAARDLGVIPLANIGGTAQAATADLPANYVAAGLTALMTGNSVRWIPTANNTAANPTITVAGVTYTIQRANGTPLAINALRSGREAIGRVASGSTIRLTGGITELEISEQATATAALIRTAIDETGRVTLTNVTQSGNTISGDVPAALTALGVTTITRVAFTPLATNSGGTNVRLSINGAASREVRTLDGLVMADGQLRVGVPLHADWDEPQQRWRVVSPAVTRADIAPFADRVGLVSAPAIRRSTGAEFNAHEYVDFGGGLHLPSLGGVSVQDHFRRSYRQINDADAKAQRAIDSILARRRVYDAVSDFGIPNDGITNAKDQIQAAINFVSASAATSGPGVIYFPPGVYRIADGWVQPESNVIIMGAGWGRSRFLPIAQFAAFRRHANPVTLYRFSMFDVEIDCSMQSSTGPFVQAKGTYITNYQECYFVRCYVHEAWATGFGNDFGIDCWYVDGIARNCGRGTPPEVLAGGSSGIGLGTGVFEEERVIVSRMICDGNANNGAFVERQKTSSAAFKSRGTIFSELICRGNRHGVTDAGMTGLIVANSQIYDNWSHGFALDTGTLAPNSFAPHPGEYVKITGNQVFRNGGDGIHYNSVGLAANRGIQTLGNNIHQNTGAGIGVLAHNTNETLGWQFQGDYFQENGGAAINLQSGRIGGVAIKGATMLDNAGGVQIGAIVRGGRVHGCEVWNLSDGANPRPSITGAGALTDVDISENHGIGVDNINLTGTQTRVTYGRNVGM